MINKRFLSLAVVALSLTGCATQPYVSSLHSALQEKTSMYKWNDVIARISKTNFNYSIYDSSGLELLEIVNKEVNSIKYVSDISNYGVNDYWATPKEFFSRGGDCEDYAIAKYEVLKHNGFPMTDMKLVVGYDAKYHEYHTVLFAVQDKQTYVLDNQHSELIKAEDDYTFSPTYAINELNFWRF